MPRGGRQPGSGRPKGSKDKTTLEKDRILAGLRDRIMKSADSLFHAAKTKALGNQFLYKIVTTTDNKGKKTRSKPILVENQHEIMAFIDRLDRERNGETLDAMEIDDDTYYFISTKDPDVQAVKELWDRAFGRAPQPLTNDDGKPFLIGILEDV